MKFEEVVEKLPGYFDKLIGSEPVRCQEQWTGKVPDCGIYVFFECDEPFYVGRSNKLGERIKGHGALSGTQYGATFAFKLLKDKVGGKACEGKTRKEIQDEYKALFQKERERVRKMDVRVVGITNQVEQTLFETYAILRSGTTPKYNEFHTT